MKLKLSLMGGLLLASGAAMAADGEGLKVGGFVDAQFNWSHQSGVQDRNTFGINDGALYLGKTMGMGEVMVDIPFYSTAFGGTASGGPDGSTKNDFAIATKKAQAFVAWHYDNGFGWKMGQFDSLYGFEANASVDNVFTQQGVIYQFMPMTHTGLQLNYEMSDLLGINFLVSNPYNLGVMNNGASGANKVTGNPDLGFKISSKFDAFKASVGGLFFTQPGGTTKGYIIDVIAGTKMMDKLSVDLELTFDKARDANYNIPTDSRFGVGAHLGYSLMDKLNVATRFEYTKVSTLKTLGWTVGPQWWASKEAVIKLDYTLSRVDANGVVTTANGINLAAVQKF